MVTAKTLCNPGALLVDNAGNLWVADTGNSRVLRYPPPFSSGLVANQPAKLVIGQGGSFTLNGCGPTKYGLCSPSGLAMDKAGHLFVADTNNNRVVEYTPPFGSIPIANLVFGENGQLGSNVCNIGNIGPTKYNLCNPSQVALDAAGDLYVADSANSRVLEYDHALTNMTATRVFGQVSFTTNACNAVGGVSAKTLCQPAGVALDSLGRLYVEDSHNNRVLRYSKPLSSAVADGVFGQSGNFTSSGCNLGGPQASPGSLCSPTAAAFDSFGNVFLSDTNNSRLLEYNSP